jgi:hypothetical protein
MPHFAEPSVLAERATLGGVGENEDRLAPLKERVAAEHLGDPTLGSRLRGGNETQLRRDAEQLRDQAQFTGTGRPSLPAALFVVHERQRRLMERVLGWSERGAP